LLEQAWVLGLEVTLLIVLGCPSRV